MKKRLIFISALLTALTLVGMEPQPLEKTKLFFDAIEKLKKFKDPQEWLNNKITEINEEINSLTHKSITLIFTDDILENNTEDIKDIEDREKANRQLNFLKSLQNYFLEINKQNDNSHEDKKKN